MQWSTSDDGAIKGTSVNHPPNDQFPTSANAGQHHHVRHLIDDVLSSVKDRCTRHRITTTVDMPDDLIILIDGEMIRSAIRHLIVNSIEAMPGGGELVITGYQDRHIVEVEIADSGPGLLVEPIDRIFDKDYSTKPNQSGSGLTNARRIINELGAQISVVNCPEGGAAFTLHFRRSQPIQAAA